MSLIRYLHGFFANILILLSIYVVQMNYDFKKQVIIITTVKIYMHKMLREYISQDTDTGTHLLLPRGLEKLLLIRQPSRVELLKNVKYVCYNTNIQ